MIGGPSVFCGSGWARDGRVVSQAFPAESIWIPETNGALKFAGILGQFGSISKTGSGRAGLAAGCACAPVSNEQTPAVQIPASAASVAATDDRDLNFLS